MTWLWKNHSTISVKTLSIIFFYFLICASLNLQAKILLHNSKNLTSSVNILNKLFTQNSFSKMGIFLCSYFLQISSCDTVELSYAPDFFLPVSLVYQFRWQAVHAIPN